MRDGAEPDADALQRHCAEQLAGFKVPKRFEFVSELPRSESGKLLRRELR
jgi:acyl-coenzyme A synthetase/AMP-(fatty) acid ligase